MVNVYEFAIFVFRIHYQKDGKYSRIFSIFAYEIIVNYGKRFKRNLQSCS